MPEERPLIKMEINPAAVSAPFQIELQHIHWKIALALNGIEKTTADDLKLPSTPISYASASNVQPDHKGSKAECSQWIISNGLRDCAEALHAHLEITFSCCLSMKLASNGPIASETLEETYEQPRLNFHGKDLFRKLKALENEFGISFEDVTYRCFTSLNKVRNCLSHRGGIVRATDCNDNGQLKVEWQTWVPIRGDGSEVEFGKPLNSTTLDIRRDIRVQIFQQGEHINFTSRDFAEFLMNYSFLGNETSEKVVKYAQQTGLLPVSESPNS